MKNWSNTPFRPEEVLRKKGESLRKAYGRVLNNFHMRFPIGDVPNKAWNSKGFYRSDLTDKTLEELGRKHRGNDAVYSQKHRRQTMREFYAEMDAVVAEQGIPMSRLSEAINDAYLTKLGPTNWELKNEQWKKVWDLLIPVYSELRRRGYSKQDLIG